MFLKIHSKIRFKTISTIIYITFLHVFMCNQQYHSFFLWAHTSICHQQLGLVAIITIHPIIFKRFMENLTSVVERLSS